MRVYIPTSSLNADSILSCESIAPANECRKRAFGYSQFETLEELRSFDNFTLAFTKIPIFNIYDSTRENFPMVVEVDIYDVEKANLKKLSVIEDTEIFITANPILITPTNSRLLFFKREHLEYTYHSCSDSAKCKLFEFFKKRMGGINRENIGVSLSLINGLELPVLRPTYSENDYDKVKGFVWGYGLGAFLSKSSETANLLRIQKRIYDIISSTKNEEYIPQSLKAELETLDRDYSKYDPIQRLAKRKWNECLTQIASDIPNLNSDNVVETINSILVKLKVETEAKNKFLANNRIILRKPLSSYPLISRLGYEQYNADLDKHTKYALYQDSQARIKDCFFDELDIDTAAFKNGALSASDENSNLFNKMLFRIIWENLISSLEEIRVNRKDVAANVVKTLKVIVEEAGNQWQDSELQSYYDRMRKNISKYEPFVLTDIDNPIFQSIAAFVLKGEDFESLKSYLETNAVADFRYALALWGALIGYVSIPRALIQDLLGYINTAKLYNLSERILDKIEAGLCYTTDKYPNYTPVNPTERIPSTSLDNYGKTSSESSSFRHKVLQFFERTIIKGQKKERQELLRKGLMKAFDEFGNDSNPIKFVSLLNEYVDYGWKPTLKPWKTLRDYIAPEYEAKTRSSVSQSNMDIFSVPIIQSELPFDADSNNSTEIAKSESTNFIGSNIKDVKELVKGKDDKDILENQLLIDHLADEHNILLDGVLLNLIETRFPNLHKQLYKDIAWFVDNYKPSYFDERKRRLEKGRYRESPQDFRSVLKKLDGFLHRPITREKKWLADIYINLPIDNIMSYLYHLYGI